jgi:hypothetical protein
MISENNLSLKVNIKFKSQSNVDKWAELLQILESLNSSLDQENAYSG